MSTEVEQYVRNCGACVLRNTPYQRAAPLHQIVSFGPLELVCIDFFSMEPDSRGVNNVQVVTDHFTRYAQAVPTRNQKITVRKSILYIMAFHLRFISIKEETSSLSLLNNC